MSFQRDNHAFTVQVMHVTHTKPSSHVMGAYVTCENNSMTYGHMICVME